MRGSLRQALQPCDHGRCSGLWRFGDEGELGGDCEICCWDWTLAIHRELRGGGYDANYNLVGGGRARGGPVGSCVHVSERLAGGPVRREREGRIQPVVPSRGRRRIHGLFGYCVCGAGIVGVDTAVGLDARKGGGRCWLPPLLVLELIKTTDEGQSGIFVRRWR